VIKARPAPEEPASWTRHLVSWGREGAYGIVEPLISYEAYLAVRDGVDDPVTRGAERARQMVFDQAREDSA